MACLCVVDLLMLGALIHSAVGVCCVSVALLLGVDLYVPYCGDYFILGVGW